MRVEDLRPLALLDGLDDDQVGQLVSDGEEVPIVPGSDLFHEGEHADSWWVLVDGALDLVRAVGGEETVVRRMDTPGQWAGGFRAWDESGVYLATGRGAVPGRMLRVPAEALRDRLQEWFPFGVHLIGGLYATARSIESTVRQRESLVTLGTLAAGLAHELNNPAAAATRSVDALDAVCTSLLASLRRLADGRPHGRPLRAARRAPAADRAAVVDARPDPARRRRGGAHHLAGTPGRGARLDDRSAARVRRRGRGLVRARGRAAGRSDARAGAHLGGQHPLDRSADRGGA